VYRLRLATSPAISCLILPLLFLGPDVMSAEQLPIRTYTTPEGLAHNHINRIRQDSRGYLWSCTDGGLSRFGGYRFTNYTTRGRIASPLGQRSARDARRRVLDCDRRRRLPFQSQRLIGEVRPGDGQAAVRGS
jgi:ligand-binding sensor domain-containing protein